MILFKDNKFKPINFEFLLTEQLVVTSMMSTDPVMSVRVGEVVSIYNTIVE